VARIRLVLCAALALSAFATPAATRAQPLQRVTVTQFRLTANTTTPKLEEPFRLVITVHVRERINDLEDLDLPILAALEILGDERTLSSDSGGTTYTETIDAVAHHTGRITIDPAILDVIDARDGRPKQYESNPLVLVVGAAPLAPLNNAGSAIVPLLRALTRIMLTILTVIAFIAVVILLFRRPARAPVAAGPAVEPMLEPPCDPRARLRDALATLRVERTRATAMRVRAVARGLVGAGETETLGDVLRRPGANDPSMRALLISLERAGFTYDVDLQPAIDAAIAQLERMT
jgi:hypothetical protein